MTDTNSMLKDIQETAKQHMMAAKTLVAEEKEIKNRLKAEADKKKAEEKIKEEQEAREHVINIINSFDLYYIEENKCFYRSIHSKDKNNNVIKVKQFIKSGELDHTVLLERKYNQLFFEEMRKQKDIKQRSRTMTSMNFSIPELGKDVLNFGDDLVDGLMKINYEDTTPHSQAFDILIETLGGHHKEQVQELKKMIAYRYITIRDRSRFTPPIPVIVGRGGTGKNVLFDSILPNIWGYNYSSTLSTGDVSGDYTDGIAEMALIFLDEFEPKNPKEAANMLKRLTNEILMSNGKFKQKYKIYNYAWLAVGTNDHRGAFNLANSGDDSEDRRFLICKVKKSLFENAIEYGIDLKNDKKANAKFFSTLTNKTEINRWMRDLLEEFEESFYNDDGSIIAFVSAYKGPDYREIVLAQEQDWKSFVREYLENEFNITACSHVKKTKI